MRKDRMIVFLLRRRYLLMALALAAAGVLFRAACRPDLLLCGGAGEPKRRASLGWEARLFGPRPTPLVSIAILKNTDSGSADTDGTSLRLPP